MTIDVEVSSKFATGDKCFYRCTMNKHPLLEQMVEQLKTVGRIAQHASADADNEARTGATADEKRLDARVALEYSQMAKAQARRAEKARTQLKALRSFDPGPTLEGKRIAVGSIVEIEDEETGAGRTFFLAPVGAGMSLTGPDGDGHITVVTPASPIGRAVRGRCAGDVIDVTIDGNLREWLITFAC